VIVYDGNTRPPLDRGMMPLPSQSSKAFLLEQPPETPQQLRLLRVGGGGIHKIAWRMIGIRAVDAGGVNDCSSSQSSTR
jgi:hypothetical protein